MDKISFPTTRMREIGQQIRAETNDLIQENAIHFQQIRNTYERLPAPLQNPLDNVLSSLQRNLVQVLALRQSIGGTLIEAAGSAGTTDTGIAQGFEEH
jgi:hypothetical protein